MNERKISKIGVIGQGTMGSQIAQAILTAGLDIKIFDINSELAETSHARLIKNIKKSVKRGVMSIEKAQSMEENLTLAKGFEEFSDRELIIEAVFEDKQVKDEIFSKLESIVSTTCILASNTSSLSITSLAKNLSNRSRFVGLHFFYPAFYNKLVEVVRGYLTDDGTIEAACAFVRSIEKDPVIAKDTPGFIVNRILVPMIGEAIKLVELNVACPEDIDNAMVLGTSLPQGPLKLADMVGLDVILKVQEIFYSEYGEASYKPSILLKRMVDAGYLGLKTGRGFYQY